jgi:hypothetical protein
MICPRQLGIAVPLIHLCLSTPSRSHETILGSTRRRQENHPHPWMPPWFLVTDTWFEVSAFPARFSILHIARSNQRTVDRLYVVKIVQTFD